MTTSAAAGRRARCSMNAADGIRSTSAAVNVVNVAERASPSMAATSPRMSPGPSTSSTTSRSSTVAEIFSSPVRIRTTSWAASPSKKMIDCAG